MWLRGVRGTALHLLCLIDLCRCFCVKRLPQCSYFVTFYRVSKQAFLIIILACHFCVCLHMYVPTRTHTHHPSPHMHARTHAKACWTVVLNTHLNAHIHTPPLPSHARTHEKTCWAVVLNTHLNARTHTHTHTHTHTTCYTQFYRNNLITASIYLCAVKYWGLRCCIVYGYYCCVDDRYCFLFFLRDCVMYCL